MSIANVANVVDLREPSWLRLWAKTGDRDPGWHPLPYHLLDVAACTSAILASQPQRLERMAKILGVDGESLGALSVALVALHDVGKCGLGFQYKVPELFPSCLGPAPSSAIPLRHDAGGVWLATNTPIDDRFTALLPRLLPSTRTAVAQSVFCHHGEPADVDSEIRDPSRQIGGRSIEVAGDLVEAMLDLFKPRPLPVADRHGAQLSWWLAGLTVLSDWLGSNARWFPFQVPGMPLAEYWHSVALPAARRAVAEAGIVPAPVSPRTGFAALVGADLTPSPLQRWAESVEIPLGPVLVVIEDMTGAGKTEASITLGHRIMVAHGHAGLHIGLPTSATATAMYSRLARLYRNIFNEGPSVPSITLAHGRRGRVSLDDASEVDGSAFCADWLARSNKTAFLAQVGSATIDQSILSILPVRHQALRLWGLGDAVLVVDEAHAYDSYMQRELETVLHFLAAMGCSCIVLSATLPAVIKLRLVEAWQRGFGERSASWRPASGAYPLTTTVSAAGVIETPVALRAGLARTVPVCRVASIEEAHARALQAARQGAAVAVIRNTVDESGESFEALRREFNDATLFHARFCAGDRARIEGEVLARWGKDGDGRRRAGILVATQVIEQSLDLDFDLVLSDLAPVDLLIQRAGRYRRHPRGERPIPGEFLVISPPADDDAGPAWPGPLLPRTALVYRHRAVLWRSARTLFARGAIVTEEVRELVESVYGDGAEAVPEGLQAAEVAADNKSSGDRTLGQFVALNFRHGYTWNGSKWDREERARTRLGEQTVTIRLGKLVGGTLQPMADNWALSEVGVRASRLAEASNPRHVNAMVDALRRSWTVSEAEMPVVAMENTGGVWVGAGVSGGGKTVAVEYTATRGVRIER